VSALEDDYDEGTLARLDAWAPRRPAAPRMGHRLAAGAFIAAIGLGLQEVLEDRPSEPVVEEIDAWDDDPTVPVRLLWIADNPQATIALILPLHAAALPR
jgi:hypothetical protein